MTQAQELCMLFRGCFPFAVRGTDTVRRILGDETNHVITRRDENNWLIAASVIHGDAIYMLCVDPKYRNAGLGGELLAESERHIRAQGHRLVRVGAGDDYLTPGIPTDKMPFAEALMPAQLCDGLSDDARAFFAKRGYVHSWGECNCFDMSLRLSDFDYRAHSVGDEIDGVRYRWAVPDDIAAVCACTDDAHESFTRYYANAALYAPYAGQRVLIAEADGGVRGALIVSREAEAPGTGSVGCTAVAHDWRGRHIAANMVLLGTRHLKNGGLERGFLGYTYSGLDRLYALAGYRICTYYFMARKAL